MKKTLLTLALSVMTFVVLSQDLKKSAQEHFNNEEWAEAIKDYKKYLKKNKSDSSVWYALAGTYAKAEQFGEAIESFEKAKETNFSILFVAYSMAKVYAKTKNEGKMLAALNEGADNGLPIYTRMKSEPDFEAYKSSNGFGEVLEKVKNNAYPCLSSENDRHFDFWLGEWDVYANGRKVGDNSITKAKGGCAIHENYITAGNYAGQSINYYDPIDKKWHQHWVGSGGDVYNYLETKRSEGMLQFESKFMGANGQISLSKLTFTLNEDGTVRQLFEGSTDGGKTWTPAFDGLYKKKE